MTTGFPSYPKTAWQGEAGVAIVSRAVGRLGWIFRRNHNEHDFGIDGYIDLVAPSGSVTGRMLAVQIKCGPSYLAHTNQFGFTYYGEPKHINYLLNHPIPVLLILCDQESETCYWEHFCGSAIESTPKAWKLDIPKRKTLSEALRSEIESVAGAPIDYTSSLQEYWRINDEIKQSDMIILPICKAFDVDPHDVSSIVEFFERLTRTDAFALANQGKVELWFTGWDDDQREIWEIPEVIAFLRAIEPLCKYWFFFLRTEKPTCSLEILAMAFCSTGRTEADHDNDHVATEIDISELELFVRRNFGWLNELTERLKLAECDNERISRAVLTCITSGLASQDG
jgi:hypothetical protein